MSELEVALEPVPLAQKERLWRLFQLYRHDLSEYTGDLPGDDGTYAYRYFDPYWTEPGRQPYFIRAGGDVAGFVLIRELSKDELDDVIAEVVEERGVSVYSIAEFFVLRPFRRKGVGEAAAQLAFALYPGPWQVSQLEKNLPAREFWGRLIDGPMMEWYEDDSVVQFFSA